VDSSFELEEGPSGQIIEHDREGWRVRFDTNAEAVERYMERQGEIPLPPYIHREPDGGRTDQDRERYQTVYARQSGAVAAPTAGLHFTVELLDRLRAQGVRTATLTLHVGPGTFLPVRSDRIEDHRMHTERFELTQELASEIEEVRARGRRVVATGTTVVRTLETRFADGGRVRPGRGRTDLFIRPGYEFRVVDAMITNFHLPRSTLLMLVSAFAGRERVLSAYREAIEAEYRFFSYGDAMWIG
jgi:S-adenosylmethionine:tRNA ribosyltransferase-isomerase